MWVKSWWLTLTNTTRKTFKKTHVFSTSLKYVKTSEVTVSFICLWCTDFSNLVMCSRKLLKAMKFKSEEKKKNICSQTQKIFIEDVAERKCTRLKIKMSRWCTFNEFVFRSAADDLVLRQVPFKMPEKSSGLPGEDLDKQWLWQPHKLLWKRKT